MLCYTHAWRQWLAGCYCNSAMAGNGSPHTAITYSYQGSRVNTELFGLDFQRVNFDQAVKHIINSSKSLQAKLLVTPNTDHIILINKDEYVRKIFRSANIVVADGMPIVWISRLIPNKSLPERITGADLMPALCYQAAQLGLSVAFIGSTQESANMAMAALKRKSPELDIKGHYSPPLGFENDPEESQKIVAFCQMWKPNILFLCLGTPKQEKWAFEHLLNTNCGVIACVGAAIDMLSGKVKRAPNFMQKCGLEWLWRLCLEPKRLWRRYLLDDTQFLYYGTRELLVQWWSHYKKP